MSINPEIDTNTAYIYDDVAATLAFGEVDDDYWCTYFGARYYDPSISIWLSVDPLSDEYPGHSPYNYTLNNPIRFVDPDGRLVGEYEQDAAGNWQKVSTKGDEIGVDYYHWDGTDAEGNSAQKTYVTDRNGNWNVINNGRYALMGQLRDGNIGWSEIFDEFQSGTGPERSVFEGAHPSNQQIKKSYLYRRVLSEFLASDVYRAGASVDFTPLDIIGSVGNMQSQMMGSYNASFYKLGDRVLSLVQDSKSRTSFYLRLPVTDYTRDQLQYKVIPGGYGFPDLVIPHKMESNTYQSYIFFN